MLPPMSPELQKTLRDNFPALYPSECRLEAPDGWFNLITLLSLSLVREGPDAVCVQAKEKFGGLRFYIEGPPWLLSEKGGELISRAEEVSFNTCQVCGEPGKLRRISLTVATLCGSCYGG